MENITIKEFEIVFITRTNAGEYRCWQTFDNNIMGIHGMKSYVADSFENQVKPAIDMGILPYNSNQKGE